MVNSDTVKLLQECDAGTKMAVTTIDEVLESVRDTDMRAKITTKSWETRFTRC